jgi:hypothetical protein
LAWLYYGGISHPCQSVFSLVEGLVLEKRHFWFGKLRHSVAELVCAAEFAEDFRHGGEG